MRVVEIVSTMGPSRRAEKKVVEMVLQAEASEANQFDSIATELQTLLPPKLNKLGLSIEAAEWSDIIKRNTGIAQLAGYVGAIALALQNAAGHALQFHDFLQDKDPETGEWRYRFIFQHDDIPSGEQAGDLAMRIVANACPHLHWQALLHDATQTIAASIAEFLASTRPLVTPADTLELIAAAQARQIPVLRLEREPYGALPASFRVAPNGMIMLGHSRHRVIMDGLYCVDRPGPGFSIMSDRRELWQLLTRLEAPTPADDMARLSAHNLSQALRIARQLEYPLRAYPLQRDPKAINGWLVSNDAELEQLYSPSGASVHTLLLEPDIPGQSLDLIFAGGKPLSSLLDGQAHAPDPAIVACAVKIERAINAGFLHLQLKIQPADESSGMSFVFTNLDPSPPLAQLLKDYPQWKEKAYRQFLDWLYPSGTPCRIPIVSVTGTNGKTTTSTMLARMAQAESLFVGMARTTGVYFDQELKEFGDSSGFLGHCMVFENSKVELAVLETARGDVLRSGFAYDYADVAICTNVTADHLGEHGVETVEDMAVVKRSILERSVGAVVLNGDDPLCLAMLPCLRNQTIFLSTFQVDPESLRQHIAAEYNCKINIIHVAQQDGEEWIVLRVGDAITPIVAVNSVPATFNGTAGHNISNAMHAIAAAYALGLKLTSIRKALASFEMGFESLPGRLNVHDNGRFHIIMDYAHNADGLRQLVRFTDQYPCKGRKILRFGVSPNASEAACLGAAATVAGHFDHYICSAKPGHVPGDGIDTAAVLQRSLLKTGIAEDQVEIFTDVSRSVEYPASLCQPGDLLILVTSNALLATTWEQVLKT